MEDKSSLASSLDESKAVEFRKGEFEGSDITPKTAPTSEDTLPTKDTGKGETTKDEVREVLGEIEASLTEGEVPHSLQSSSTTPSPPVFKTGRLSAPPPRPPPPKPRREDASASQTSSPRIGHPWQSGARAPLPSSLSAGYQGTAPTEGSLPVVNVQGSMAGVELAPPIESFHDEIQTSKKIEEVEEFDIQIQSLRDRVLQYEDEEDYFMDILAESPREVIQEEFIDDGSWGEEDFNYFDVHEEKDTSDLDLPFDLRHTQSKNRLVGHLFQTLLPFCMAPRKPTDEVLGAPMETFINFTNHTTNQLHSWSPHTIQLAGHLGGMFYLVRHSSTGHNAVLKVVRKDATRRTFRHITLERHIWRITSKHRHVLSLEAFFESGKCYCFVSEFAVRGSLSSFLRQNGPIRESRAVKLTAQIASALRFIHDIGIIHRNVCSSNIMLSRKGRARLCDFSNSTFEKIAHGVPGKIKYLAPEVLRGIDYDMASDWWSVGVVMYEMVTGRTPVDIFLERQGTADCNDSLVITDAIIFGEIYLPSHLETKTKCFLSDILQKNPKERLGSAFFPDFKSHIIFSAIEWQKLERGITSSASLPRLHNHNVALAATS